MRERRNPSRPSVPRSCRRARIRGDRVAARRLGCTKGAITRFTAPAYWKFESIFLQRRVRDEPLPPSALERHFEKAGPMVRIQFPPGESLRNHRFRGRRGYRSASTAAANSRFCRWNSGVSQVSASRRACLLTPARAKRRPARSGCDGVSEAAAADLPRRRRTSYLSPDGSLTDTC